MLQIKRNFYAHLIYNAKLPLFVYDYETLWRALHIDLHVTRFRIRNEYVTAKI